MIYIIGAGIAGLVAGWALQRDGCEDFLIFEGSSSVGGQMKKVQLGGADFPLGLRQIRLTNSRVIAMLAELGIPLAEKQHDGRAFDFYDTYAGEGRFIPLPLEKHFGLRPPIGCFNTMAEYIKGYNHPLVTSAIQGYLEKSNKLPAHLMACIPDSMNKLVENSTSDNIRALEVAPEQLVNALAAHLKKQIITGHQLRSVSELGLVFETNGIKQTFNPTPVKSYPLNPSDTVVFTLPLPMMIGIIKAPPIMQNYAEQLDRAISAIAISKASIPSALVGRSFYYPQREVIFHRLTFLQQGFVAEITLSRTKTFLLQLESYRQLISEQVNSKVKELHSITPAQSTLAIDPYGIILPQLIDSSARARIFQWLETRGFIAFGRFAEWSGDVHIATTLRYAPVLARRLIKGKEVGAMPFTLSKEELEQRFASELKRRVEIEREAEIDEKGKSKILH